MQHHEADTVGSVGTARQDRPAQPLPANDAFEATAGQVLAGYLNSRCGDFLRSLRLYGESGSDTAAAEEAASALRCSARRIAGSLHTFRVLLDPAWADQLRTELGWLSGTLAQEYACTARLHRLVSALARLSGAAPAQGPVPAARQGEGALTVGASRAGALLERQLTLARTRSHSAALQALGSSRFHAVADAVAVLASEVPLAPVAGAPAAEILAAPQGAAERRLLDAVSTLPLARAAHPYNAEALVHGLSTPSDGEAQDAPWHQVRLLLRLHRYAQEVRHTGGDPDPVLAEAGRALDRHRDAAEAAAASANAARTPRIAPATAYALGVLHADQRHEVEAARYDFQQIWTRRAVSAP